MNMLYNNNINYEVLAMLLENNNSKKITRFDARINPEIKDFLKKAAQMEGYTSLADFVISSAYKAAKKIVTDHELLMLTDKDKKYFVQEYLKPAKPNSELKEAIQGYKNYFNL